MTDSTSITADEYHQLMARDMKEKRLQECVIAAARSLGWRVYHTYSSVRSEPGYPDLHLVHTRHRASAFVELKTMTGKLSAAQQNWLRDLNHIGEIVCIWRPIDWVNGTIQAWLADPSGPRPGRLS